ncbi:MAG TPA: hypothetical protein VFU93_15625 [Acidimicrobiales bacterium]|nr:hypothetical protein [Acidimicrobiales bacterium]
MIDPVVARKTWRTLEPIHGFVYFSPDAEPAYVAAGLKPGRMGYFASRSAPMGAVPAEVVIATFFNFHHGLVRSVIPEAWTLSTPERVLEARLSVADQGLRRMLGDGVGSPELAEAATLARTAAEVACERPEGRPLFAGHAALPWPDEPHLVLWHAQTLLREFRGDAHVAALTLQGMSGLDALVCHAASGDVPADTLRTTRAYSEDEWAAGVESLARRGIVNADGSFTDAGRQARDEVERLTDERSVAPYDAIGEDGCDRLRSLARPFSKAISEAAFGR